MLESFPCFTSIDLTKHFLFFVHPSVQCLFRSCLLRTTVASLSFFSANSQPICSTPTKHAAVLLLSFCVCVSLSLSPLLSIDLVIVFCLQPAGWLALINTDNCLLSPDAKQSVFFLNESRSSPNLHTYTHTQGPPTRDSPPLMTGDNLLSLPIFFFPPLSAPPLIDCREISPHVPLSPSVNTPNTWHHNYTLSHKQIRITKYAQFYI